MFVMQGNVCIVIFLVFASVSNEVSAECPDSLICGDKTNEILLIAAVVGVCVLFLVQCIVIVCLAHKLGALKKRIEKLSLSRGTYTYHTTYPHLSLKESVIENAEDITYVPSRGERHFSASFPASNRRSTVGSNYTNDHELTVIDNPDANGGKEIWNLY